MRRHLKISSEQRRKRTNKIGVQYYWCYVQVFFANVRWQVLQNLWWLWVHGLGHIGKYKCRLQLVIDFSDASLRLLARFAREGDGGNWQVIFANASLHWLARGDGGDGWRRLQRRRRQLRWRHQVASIKVPNMCS